MTSHFDSDVAFAQQMAATWSGGFIPAEQHRLVKFLRAEAAGQETIFDPTAWKLETPRQFFQFGRLLVSAILVHAEQLPAIRR